MVLGWTRKGSWSLLPGEKYHSSIVWGLYLFRWLWIEEVFGLPPVGLLFGSGFRRAPAHLALGLRSRMVRPDTLQPKSFIFNRSCKWIRFVPVVSLAKDQFLYWRSATSRESEIKVLHLCRRDRIKFSEYQAVYWNDVLKERSWEGVVTMLLY